MGDSKWNLIGPVAGIAFVALVFAGMGVAAGSANPEPSDSSNAIAKAFADTSDQTQLGSMLTLLGLTFFFPFLAYLRQRLQQAEGDGGWLATTTYGGGLVSAAMLLLLVSIHLATTAVQTETDQVVGKVFVVYTWNWIYVMAPPLIALTLGTSLSIVRYATVPRWLGWIGFPVTVTLLAPWIGFPVTLGWIGLLSISLVVKEVRSGDAVESPADTVPHLVS